MTNKQKYLLKNLYNALTDITEEAEQDENFNLQLADIIQENNITTMSLDDINYIISQKLEEKEYNFEYDIETDSFLVFNTTNENVYASVAKEEEAKKLVDTLNINR